MPACAWRAHLLLHGRPCSGRHPLATAQHSPALAEIAAEGLQPRDRARTSEKWPASHKRPLTGFWFSADDGRVVSEAYSLLPGDLRNTKACQAALEAAGFDPACPTYVLAECVLVYMDPEDSSSVVRWLGQWLRTAAFVVYEQVSPSCLRCEGVRMCISPSLGFRRVSACGIICVRHNLSTSAVCQI